MKTDIKKSLQISEQVYSTYKNIWGSHENTKNEIIKALDNFIFEYIEYDMDNDSLEDFSFSLKSNKTFREIKKWLKERIGLESIDKILKEAFIKDVENNMSEKIEVLWGRLTKTHRWGFKFIDSIEDEIGFHREANEHLVFPEYKDLVSKPSEHCWETDNHKYRMIGKKELSQSRKAELLLIGEFEWNGLLIAKSKPLGIEDNTGWLVNLDHSYIPASDYNDLWTTTIEQRDINEKLDWITSGFFKPFINSCHTMPLANFLYREKLEKPENMRAIYLDFNQYNLEENNIDFVSNKGAVMKCSRCKTPVSTKNSKVIAKERACLECLEGKYSSELIAIRKS